MSLSEQIQNLYSAKQFGEICAVYDGSPVGETELTSDGDYVCVMNGLYNQKRYSDCLALYKRFVRNFPENDKLDIKMGWCVYHLFVKPCDFSVREAEAEARKKVEYVLRKVRDGQYAPNWMIVRQVTKGILGRNTISREDYSRCNRYLECVDRANLSREEYVTADGGKKLPSAYEQWFSKKTRCLSELGAYSECIRLCDEGLRTIPSFHGNNDSWFRVRKAFCLLQTGKTAEAKATAAELPEHGVCHWSIYELLFDIAAAGNEPQEAMKYIGCCALADNQHQMRVNFYVKAADFLQARGSEREAMMHRRLAVLLREEQGWRVKREDRQGIGDGVEAMGKKEVLSALRRFWEKHRDQGKIYVFGKIASVFPEKRHGWVQDEAGRSFFFRFRDVTGSPSRLQVGVSVLFVVGKRMDPKYNKMRENAVEVKLRSH